MRKGFSATLATVAFAMLGTHAMALAPTISEIPDIIVGDAEDTSAANVFVFPDALNLNSLVSDDETTAGGIIWSYWIAGAGGVYRINDADPVPDPSDASNIVNPPAAQRVDTNTDPGDVDGNPRTITFRDIMRSPLPAQASYGDPAGGPGILNESRVITLFASDGSTVSLDEGQSFVVFTEDDNFDQYSGEAPDTAIYTEGSPGLNWTQLTEFGTATFSQPGGDACITTTAGAGKVNLARWHSDYGAVQLTANTVYEARLQVSTSQTNFNETPLWSWVWENVSADGTQGQNEYGGEYFVLDNENGANSPISGVGRSEFEFWMFPPQGRTPQFQDSTNGFFRAGLSGNQDMRLNFRLFDFSDGGYGAESDSGTICLENVSVFSHDLGSMAVESTVYDVSTMAGPDPLVAGSWFIEPLGDPTDISFAGGNVTISPQSSWTNPTLISGSPGDATQGPITDPAAIADNWPIDWESDGLYYIEFLMSAPSADDESNPPDVLLIGADTPTAELTMMNFIFPTTPDPSVAAPANLRGVSMPRTGTPQQYAAFFSTHSQTDSGLGDSVAIWRPRVQIINSNLLSPGGRVDNTGGITIHGVTVQKVTF